MRHYPSRLSENGVKRNAKRLKNVNNARTFTGHREVSCHHFSVFVDSRNHFFKKMILKAIILRFRIQLVDIVTETQQIELNRDIMLSPSKKPLEMTVMFQNTKSTFDLYRAIKAKLYTFWRGNVPPGLLAQLHQITLDGEHLVGVLFRLKTLILEQLATAIAT